jgi:acetylglutamate kinase
MPIIPEMAQGLAGRSFVVRVGPNDLDDATTFYDDIAYLSERGVRPIVIAPDRESARACVRRFNRIKSTAVGLSGADAAFLAAASPEAIGRVDTQILMTLSTAGYVPVIEPTALGIGGNEIELTADDVACAIAAATEAARALFFHDAGGVSDPATSAVISELTPAEALAISDEPHLETRLRSAVRAAARGVRAGVGAAQIIDGRVAHATIVELLTTQHLGTQVSGGVYVA